MLAGDGMPEPAQGEMKQRTLWGDTLTQPRAPEAANKPPAGKQ